MDVLPVNYMPGDPILIDKIVYELKSQGIFDNFRRECISDVDTKPAYQNLRQRVEGNVAGFLRTQNWSPDMNKNQLRELLRKTIHDSGFLETGVERIVDQVVNPKMTSVFLPKVSEVVYKYLGIERPNKSKNDLNTTAENLMPKDLEAVSPESGPFDKSGQSLEDSKMEEDESPPFEPIDDPIIHEENSVDSNVSGFSGLMSHDSNHSEGARPLQIDMDTQMSKNSSEGIFVQIEENKMEICEDSNSKCFEVDASDNSLNCSKKEESKVEEKKEEEKKEEEKKEDKKDEKKDRHRSDSKRTESRSDKRDDRKSDKKDKHSSSSSRDRKDSGHRDSRSRSDKDKHHSSSSSSRRSSSSHNKSSSSSRKESSSSSRDKKDYKSDSKDRSRDKSKDTKTIDTKKSSHSSSSHSKSDHRKSSSSSSRHDKKDPKKRSKDDHFSSKHKPERRSTDRDSNDGSGLKSSSSSYSESNSSSQNSTNQNNKPQDSSNSNSNDSGNSEGVETRNPVILSSSQLQNSGEFRLGHDKRIILPKIASNIHEARRLMKIRKQLRKIEKQSSLTLVAMNKNFENEPKKEEKVVEEELLKPRIMVSMATWDALEAKLNETMNFDTCYDPEYAEKTNNLKELRLNKAIINEDIQYNKIKAIQEIDNTPVAQVEEDVLYFNVTAEDERKRKVMCEGIARLEAEIRDMQANFELSMLNNIPTIEGKDVDKENKEVGNKRKHEDIEHIKKIKNNNNVITGHIESFSLPLSPAESDKSTDKKSDLETPVSNNKKSKNSKHQRYSSDDLYKPRPTFKRSATRRGANVD